MATYLLANGVVIAEVVPGADFILIPPHREGDFWKTVGMPPQPIDPAPIGHIPAVGADGDLYWKPIYDNIFFGYPNYLYEPRGEKIVRWMTSAPGKVRVIYNAAYYGTSPAFYFNGQRVTLSTYDTSKDGWGWVKFKPANDAFPKDLRIYATRLDTNENYASGTAFIVDINGTTKVRLSATSDHTAGDFSSAQGWQFLKWTKSDDSSFNASGNILDVTPYQDDHYYLACWKPTSCRMVVTTGQRVSMTNPERNGTFVKRYEGEFCDIDINTDNLPMGHITIVLRKDTTFFDINTGKTRGVGKETPLQESDFPYTIYNETDTEGSDQTEFAVEVRYSVLLKDRRDRIIASLGNTYLLRGANYSVSPSQPTLIEDDGTWEISYDQPVNTTYTVDHRPIGDFESLSGSQADTLSSKLWKATFSLFKVPIDPEDPEYPEEPEDEEEEEDPENDNNGAQPDGEPGLPSINSPIISLGIVSETMDVITASAGIFKGTTQILSVTYPDNPIGSVTVERNSSYLMKLNNIPSSVDAEVTVDGVYLAPQAGETWVIQTPDSPKVINVTITLSEKQRPILVLDVQSYPEPLSGENTVQMSPNLTPENGVYYVSVGDEIIFTPVSLPGYYLYAWRMVDTTGADNYVETNNTPYKLKVAASTSIVAYFKKVELSVDLNVVGWPGCDRFAFNGTDEDEGDAVPSSFDNALVYKDQVVGIYKKDDRRLVMDKDIEWNQTPYVDMPISRVEYSLNGGASWIDCGGDYVEAYNQANPTGPTLSEGRAAAIVGKFTITNTPDKGVVKVRVYLTAIASVSVGMPPVTNWVSMTGTGQNNWGCGFGTASIVNNKSETASMEYLAPLSGNPNGTPGVDFYEYYPFIVVELGSVITLDAEPADGFHFVGYQQGYFAHAWEDTGVPKDDENRVRWPAEYFIANSPSASTVVDCGLFKVMARFGTTPVERYVIFTRDSGTPLNLINPNTGEDITHTPWVPVVQDWSATPGSWDGTRGRERPEIDPPLTQQQNPINKPLGDDTSAWYPQFLATFGLTEQMLWDEGADFDIAIRVNRLGSGENKTYPLFTLKNVWMWMVSTPNSSTNIYIGDNPGYIGLFKRVHTVVNGVHTASPWEYVGHGERTLDTSENPPVPTSYHKFDLNNQKFFANIEYRCRFLPLDQIPTEKPWSAVVGYNKENDMQEGEVFWKTQSIQQVDYTGPLSALRVNVDIAADEQLFIKAVPEEGYIFVSWCDLDGVVISTEPEHLVDKHTEGNAFLAIFQPDILPPEPETTFHVGYLPGHYERGRARVSINHNGVMIVNEEVPENGRVYSAPNSATAYVVGVPNEGYVTQGWANEQGNVIWTEKNYYPLAQQRYYADVAFEQYQGPPPDPEKRDLTIMFINETDAANAICTVKVGGKTEAVLAGVLTKNVPIMPGKSVTISVSTLNGYSVSGFLDKFDSLLKVNSTAYSFTFTEDGNDVIKILLQAPTPEEPEEPEEPGELKNAGLWLLEASDKNKQLTWRSKRFEFAIPLSLSSVRLWRNGTTSMAPPTLTLYQYSSPERVESSASAAMKMRGGDARRVPTMRREHYFEVEVTSNDPIDRVALGTSMGSLR